jgi:hypothetical protein
MAFVIGTVRAISRAGRGCCAPAVAARRMVAVVARRNTVAGIGAVRAGRREGAYDDTRETAYE